MSDMFDAAYFGGYRTRSFSEIFPNVTTFKTEFEANPFPDMLQTGTEYANFGINTIYALLMARFYQSHIATDNEDSFKIQLWSRIFEHGTTWQRQMVLQQKYLTISDDSMTDGGKVINNHAKNPGTEPSTGSLDELTYIDEQTATRFKKYGPDVWKQIEVSLNSDVCRRFTDKFKDLFITVTAPDFPLYYEEENT